MLRMVHQGQGLPLGLEAGDDLPRVHAGLDDLEGHLAADRAAAARPRRPGRSRPRRSAPGACRGRSACPAFGRWPRTSSSDSAATGQSRRSSSSWCAQQGFKPAPQSLIAGTDFRKIGRPLFICGFVQRGGENGCFSHQGPGQGARVRKCHHAPTSYATLRTKTHHLRTGSPVWGRAPQLAPRPSPLLPR